MTGETLQEIYRRLGLPAIPQEAIDKARVQIREHESRMADPQVIAEIDAHNETLLAQFRRPKVEILPGETLPEIHRRLGLPEIPQEAIDKARREFEEQERVLADPVRKASRLAESAAMLAYFRQLIK